MKLSIYLMAFTIIGAFFGSVSSIGDPVSGKISDMPMPVYRQRPISECRKKTCTEVVRLRSEVTGLKKKVQSLESHLYEMINELKTQKKTKETNELQINLKPAGINASLKRTCQETRAANASLSSGMYWIDPDGNGVGDDPIYVFCNMNVGTTCVLHDSESQVDVEHCADPGCYSRKINYKATSRQLKALSELSTECYQSIKYACNNAPLEFDGIAYSWWNDKNGKPQYFWAGSNANVHTCQCGIDRNCAEANKKCNCDSASPTAQVDYGVINDKNLLPITRLNFGRTAMASSSGQHTLGRFVCSGQATFDGMPKSCADLWRIGHSLSGVYSVVGMKQVETVFCDFRKFPSDPGFQTLIGFADVKTWPTYFFVQKNRDFNKPDTPIPFETERLNIGGAMNLTSGIFTAPRNGNYFFSLSGIAMMQSPSNARFHLSLLLNGQNIGHAVSDTFGTQYETYSLVATLPLKAGDKIWLQLPTGNANAFLHDVNNHYTHFTGWLLQEDISQPTSLLRAG